MGSLGVTLQARSLCHRPEVGSASWLCTVLVGLGLRWAVMLCKIRYSGQWCHKPQQGEYRDRLTLVTHLCREM